MYIAATTANGGILTPATDIDYDPTVPEYQYDPSSYDTRVYQGFGKGDYDALLKFGPNIKDWPEIAPLGNNLLLKVASYITDPVTTTDELIPSGETSSFTHISCCSEKLLWHIECRRIKTTGKCSSTWRNQQIICSCQSSDTI